MTRAQRAKRASPTFRHAYECDRKIAISFDARRGRATCLHDFRLDAERELYVDLAQHSKFEYVIGIDILPDPLDRTLDEPFDRIVSISMFERVGSKDHRVFAKIAHRCLADDGLILLHTIGKNKRKTNPAPRIDKYIFEDGDLPSIRQIADAADCLFVVKDLHNVGADYDKTLMACNADFEAAWPEFGFQFGARFYRMWRYDQRSCAGAFRSKEIQLWQRVLPKAGALEVTAGPSVNLFFL